jgi:hypothetical protein
MEGIYTILENIEYRAALHLQKANGLACGASLGPADILIRGYLGVGGVILFFHIE